MPSIAEVFSKVIFPPINAIFNWFVQLTTPQNWYGLILGLIFFVIVSRLLIAPLFGGRFSRGSDSVKNINDDEGKVE